LFNPPADIYHSNEDNSKIRTVKKLFLFFVTSALACENSGLVIARGLYRQGLLDAALDEPLFFPSASKGVEGHRQLPDFPVPA
jgi:hypothetical protein